MDDFDVEAETEPSAEEHADELDEQVSSEAEDYAGYGEEEEEEEKIKFASEEEEDKEEDEEEDDSDKSKSSKKPNPRAEKRIRQLSQRIKERERELDNFRQEQTRQQQQIYHWQIQQQRQQAEYEKQLAVYEAENKRYLRQQEKQEESTLEPVERLQREAARRARDAALAEIGPQMQELQNRIQQAEVERVREVEKMKRDERIKGYQNQAYFATDSLLENVDAKQSNFLRERLAGFVLNWAAANNVLPDDAAKEFDKFIYKYAAAKQAARKKRNGEALNRSANTPKSIPNKRRTAKGGRKIPSYAEIRKQGFPDALSWLEAHGNDD